MKKTIAFILTVIMIVSVFSMVIAQEDHIHARRDLGEKVHMTTTRKLMTCPRSSTPHVHFQQKTWATHEYQCKICGDINEKIVPHSTNWSEWYCDLG